MSMRCLGEACRIDLLVKLCTSQSHLATRNPKKIYRL
jgi:hypothetical protein